MLRIHKSQWPIVPSTKERIGVWIGRGFLVQAFLESEEVTRLTVNRVDRQETGRWEDGISWDDLQLIKADVGYADHWAYECYPPDDMVVNAASMRHLWVTSEPMAGVGWV